MSSNISDCDMYTLKLLKCLKVFCQKVIFQMVKDLYRYHSRAKKGIRDINEFCIAINKNPLKKVVGGKRYFPENFTFSYVGEDSHPDLDITMCIHLIFLVVSKGHEPDIHKMKSWEQLNTILQGIQNIRNKLSHEDGFDKKFLDQSKNDLIIYLSEISTTIYNLDIFQCDKIQIKEKYKKICKINKANINNLWNSSSTSQLIQLKEDEYGKFISSSRQKLKEIYNPYIKLNPFLKEHFNKEFELFATPKLALRNDPTRKLSYKILLSDSIALNDKSSAFILVGDAGSGKSTICKKLVQDWSNSVKGADSGINFDFLLVIDSKTSHTKLITYIKEILFQDSMENESDDDMCFLLRQLNLLFIIDDYDEKSNEAQWIFDSLFNLFGATKIIITTKPNHKANVVEHLGSNNISYDEISVQGVEDYLELFNKIQNEVSENNIKENLDSENFKTYYNNLPTNDYSSIPFDLPVFILLLIYIFKNCKKDSHDLTVFRLYVWIFKVKALEHKKLLNICEHCYKSLKDSNTINMQVPFGEVGEECSDLFSRIFKSSATLTSFQFEFLHETQIEFLAAYYIADCLLEQCKIQSYNLNNFFEINIKNSIEKRKINVRIFLAVLEILIEEKQIDIIDIKDIIGIIKDYSDDYNILWKVLHEILKLNKSNWVKEIESHYQDILPTKWKLNDSNVTSVVNILSTINITPTVFEVELKNDVTGSLKSNIKKLNKKKKNMLKGKPLVLVIDKETNSDVCKSILKFWLQIVMMKLIAFEGYIKEQCCQFLKSCHQINYINCRITTVNTLKEFSEALGKNKWKEVWIQLDEPFDKDELLSIPQLNCCTTKDQVSKVSVEFTESKNLSLAISNLGKLKPRDYKFTIVKLRMDHFPSEKDVDEMQILKEWLQEKLIFKSDIDITSSELNMLNRELHPIEVTWK